MEIIIIFAYLWDRKYVWTDLKSIFLLLKTVPTWERKRSETDTDSAQSSSYESYFPFFNKQALC